MGGGYQLVVSRVRVRTPESGPGAKTLRAEDGQMLAVSWTRGRDRFIQLPGLATFTCSGSRVVASAERSVSETAVAAAFQRSVVPLLLYFAGHEVLHASAVRSTRGVIGFCAEAGTGKSTLAYGLSTRGLPLWADDALALDVSGKLRALLLPFEPRLRDRTVRFFETSSLEPVPPAEGCAAPLAALAVIKRMAGNSDVVQIERLKGGRAFDAVVRHAYRLDLKTDFTRRKRLIENYMKIIAAVPVFEIRFRPQFQHFPSVLAAVTELFDAELGQTV
jgi:hypothetical protein